MQVFCKKKKVCYRFLVWTKGFVDEDYWISNVNSDTSKEVFTSKAKC